MTTPQLDDQNKKPKEEKAPTYLTIGKFQIRQSDIFKFVGLIAFILLAIIITLALWPYFSEIFEPGGVENVIQSIQDQGFLGVFMLLGLQLIQIIIAFIPGEVTQIAAGMIYGPWFGALIILVGCIISSAIVYAMVHSLGAPFVQDMISEKNMHKFEAFENSGKLNIIVFILFLIPGLPKDLFTYLVPLTHMKMKTFLLLSNTGRIPGIVVSTYAASELVEGNIMQSVIIFVVLAIVAIIGIVIYNITLGKKTK